MILPLVCKNICTYSQVHKYWDIDTILFFLALYTTTMDLKLNYSSFYMCLPLFKGPKVMGQLAAQLFHGQVCVIPSLSHLQGLEFISSVLFAFGICCCQLSI